MLNFSIYSAVLLLPFYLVRFELFHVPTNPVEILAGLALFFWLFRLKKHSAIFSLPKIYWLSFLLLFLGLLLSAFLNPNLRQEAGIIKGWFVFPFLFFLIILDQIDSAEKRERILKLIFVSSASVGLISLFYLLNDILTFDGRLRAFYLSPNHLAMFLIPGIIIGFFSVMKIILEKRKFDVSFCFLVSGLLIMSIVLYCTFSYGAWLALFLSLLISLLLSNLLTRPQKIKAFMLAIGLSIILFSAQLSHQKLADIIKMDERSSFASRMMIWKSAWKIGEDNPIWGIGPGNFQEKYLAYQKHFPPYLEWAVPQPHNLYLAFWLQTGILGLVGFLILIGVWIAQMTKLLKNKKSAFLETALLAIILSALIHGLIDTPYWKNDLAFIFWIVIAIGIVGTGQCPVPTLANPADTNGR